MAKKFNILLLFFCAIACILAVENETKTTTSSTTLPSTTSLSSSSEAPKTTTTEVPTTTTVTPKTTTEAPKTTTEEPKTTTEAPKTTTEVPTTTTSAPGPITTTASPPLPPPEDREWNSTCIKLRLAAQLNFSYTTLDNETKQVKYNLPASEIEKYNDDCNVFNMTQSMVLHWEDKATKEQNTAKFTFYKNGNSYYLGVIQINLVPRTIFHDANNDSVQLLYVKNSTFVTPLQMSYHCTRQQTLDLTETIVSTNVTGTITLSKMQFEAFHKKEDKTPDIWSFSSAKDCDANSTPDIVPIAVGIALSALILIVFISYLVARRRSTNRGYMSF